MVDPKIELKAQYFVYTAEVLSTIWQTRALALTSKVTKTKVILTKVLGVKLPGLQSYLTVPRLAAAVSSFFFRT